MAKQVLPCYNSPWARLMKDFHPLAKWISGWMILVFVLGVLRFPDSPIHLCAGVQYCGKFGRIHTYDEFLWFSYWKNTLTWTWILGIPSLIFLRRK